VKQLIFIITLIVGIQAPLAKTLCLKDFLLHGEFLAELNHVHHDNIDDSSAKTTHSHKHKHSSSEPEHEHSHNHLTASYVDQPVYFKDLSIHVFQNIDSPKAFTLPLDTKSLLVVLEIFRPPINS
jgi:ABC-type Zn2+ transport system substrate-binding protein/surface adhesin